MRFWRDRDTVTKVRWYRVPADTPCLPIPHAFMRTDWLPTKFEDNPGEGAVLVGEYTRGGQYDKGALPVGWRPPTHYVGTPEQWLDGSTFPANPPLVWRGGFSTACKAKDKPEGMACETGCPVCPVVSPIWTMEFADFAGFSAVPLVHTVGCEFSSRCVAGPDCETAAAWEVIPEMDFGGLTGAVIKTKGDLTWSSCCDRSV